MMTGITLDSPTHRAQRSRFRRVTLRFYADLEHLADHPAATPGRSGLGGSAARYQSAYHRAVVDWLALVTKWDGALKPTQGLRAFPAASSDALGALRAMFGTSRTALLDLYAATDGIQTTVRIEGAELDDIWLVWSVTELPRPERDTRGGNTLRLCSRGRGRHRVPNRPERR
jgi:hypothetical protein